MTSDQEKARATVIGVQDACSCISVRVYMDQLKKEKKKEKT